MKTYHLLSFSGVIFLLLLPFMENPSTEKSSTEYFLKVTSGCEDIISFTAEWYYIDLDGKKIERKENLKTPYQISLKTEEFRGTFEKISGDGNMDIVVKSGDKSLISRFNKSAIEIKDGEMRTRRIE